MQHVTFIGKINCIKISINAICNTKCWLSKTHSIGKHLPCRRVAFVRHIYSLWKKCCTFYFHSPIVYFSRVPEVSILQNSVPKSPCSALYKYYCLIRTLSSKGLVILPLEQTTSASVYTKLADIKILTMTYFFRFLHPNMLLSIL